MPVSAVNLVEDKFFMRSGRVSRAMADTLEVSRTWKFVGNDGVLTWSFKTRHRSGQMRIQAVHSAKQTNDWIQKNILDRNVKVLGYDIEYKPSFVRGAMERKTSLLQISAGDEVLLVQMLYLVPQEVPELLKRVLTDRSIRKAGVGINGVG